MRSENQAILSEIIKDINYGLKMFGEYNYYDKGASASMDCGRWKHLLSKMPADEVAEILIEVLKFEHGRPFVSDVVVRFDDIDEQYWETLMSYKQLAKFY